MKKIMFYVVMLAAERKSKTCRNLSNLRYLRAKKSVIILVLTAMAAAGNVMGQRSLTVDCSPSSGNGYTGRATISVWLDENPITVFPYTYFSIRAGVSSSISNVSYVYGGKTYTSAEIPSIGSPRPYQMNCEVGVSYGNSSVIWKRVGLSAVPSDNARINISQLGIALPAVTPHPPGFSTPENQAQWEQQRLEHGRTADAHRTAYRSALNSINVQVRNCNCANDTRVDMDIRNKLDAATIPTQQGNTGSGGSSSSGYSSGSGSSSSSGGASGSGTATGTRSTSSSSGSSSSFDAQKQEMQQRNQQKLAESQQKLNQATNNFANAMANMYQERADADERRRIREEQKEQEEYERAERNRIAAAEREAAERAEREAERRAAAEHAAYIAGKRNALKNDFKDSKVPVSVDNVTAPEIWYFAYSNSGTQVTITNVFPIAKRNDGSYPFKNTIMSEISGASTLVGWFYSQTEAEQARNRFMKTAQEGEMTVKNIAYKGKPKTTDSATGDDFWGTGTTTTPTQKKPATQKESFWE